MRARQVLVATTARLLDYARLRQRLSWQTRDEGEVLEIVVDAQGARPAYDGLSFSVPAGRDCRLICDGAPVDCHRSLLPGTGRAALFVPWPRLDYAA
jgi:hypothetical protein